MANLSARRPINSHDSLRRHAVARVETHLRYHAGFGRIISYDQLVIGSKFKR